MSGDNKEKLGLQEGTEMLSLKSPDYAWLVWQLSCQNIRGQSPSPLGKKVCPRSITKSSPGKDLVWVCKYILTCWYNVCLFISLLVPRNYLIYILDIINKNSLFIFNLCLSNNIPLLQRFVLTRWTVIYIIYIYFACNDIIRSSLPYILYTAAF